MKSLFTLACIVMFCTINAQPSTIETNIVKFRTLYSESPETKEQLKKCQEYLTAVLSISPDHTEAMVGMVYTNYTLKQYNEALAYIEKLRSLGKWKNEFDHSGIEIKSRVGIQETAIASGGEVTTEIYFEGKEGSQSDATEWKTSVKRIANSDLSDGDKIAEAFSRIVPKPVIQKPFVVYGLNGLESKDVYSKGVSGFYKFFNSRIFDNQEPTNFITVFVAEDHDYLKSFVRQELYPDVKPKNSSYAPFLGLYNPGDNIIVATGGSYGYGTLLHEMMHALMENDSPNFPDNWNEPFASLYERSVWLNGKYLKPLPNWRFNRYSPKDLTEFIHSSQMGQARIADSRMFLLYVESKGKLRDFYLYVKNGGDVKDFVENHGFTDSNYELFYTEAMRSYMTDLGRNSNSWRSKKYDKQDVLFAQEVLKSTVSPDIVVDGAWGNNTEASVIKFQEIHGLETNGKLNHETTSLLQKVYYLNNVSFE